MGAVDQEGIARRCWIKSNSDWTFAMYSPFFVSLASGNLDTHTFLNCISQDVHFLKAFAQAYELAEECADDDEDKSAIRKLRKRVKDKLKNYEAIVHEWGFEFPAEGTPIVATAKYTDFLLATASGKVEGEKVPGKIATPFERIKLAAYTLGAMAPCMRIFAHICKEIHHLLDPDDSSHIYKRWINNYCSENFEASTLQIEDMLDKLSISLTGGELEVLEKLYLQAVKLRVDFFSIQPIGQQIIMPLSRVQSPAVRLTMFCDFDMTCTAVDSSAVLAEIAIITASKVDLNRSETKLTQMSSADLRSTWGVLSAQYVEEHDQCIESIVSSETVENFNYEDLCKALEQLADFEKRANTRVIQSGVLKGLNLEDIKRAGQQLVFQDGCPGFFQKIVRNENSKTDLHILSYCWCGDLIRSAFSSGDLNVPQIYSNELAYEETFSTGEIVRRVECPMEKLQAFNDILKDRNSDDVQQLIVYIGGSVGDLLCLLKADIGIVIGSSPSLRRLGDHFGISFVPLFAGMVKKQKELVEGGSPNWKGQPGVLYTVSSWAEIHAFILGS